MPRYSIRERSPSMPRTVKYGKRFWGNDRLEFLAAELG